MRGNICDNITPVEYIELVDNKYSECKEKKLSRFSAEWSEFSAELNIVRRRLIENIKNNRNYWNLMLRTN